MNVTNAKSMPVVRLIEKGMEEMGVVPMSALVDTAIPNVITNRPTVKANKRDGNPFSMDATRRVCIKSFVKDTN